MLYHSVSITTCHSFYSIKHVLFTETYTCSADVKVDSGGVIQPVVDSQVMPAVDERWDKLELTVAHLAAVGCDDLLTGVDR